MKLYRYRVDEEVSGEYCTVLAPNPQQAIIEYLKLDSPVKLGNKDYVYWFTVTPTKKEGK